MKGWRRASPTHIERIDGSGGDKICKCWSDQGYVYRASRRVPGPAGWEWVGPWRYSAQEAAQDFEGKP